MDDARRLNVLLVDDRTAHPLSHAAILGGLDLVRVRLGAETLARLAEREFAVIVLDVNLPGIDGFETAASIRRQPRFAKTPIVLVSDVVVTDADQLHGCQPGAFGEVCVPAVPETLRSKVQALAELHDRRKKLEDLDCNAAQAADGARGLAAPDETSASASARLARKNVMTLRELDGRGRGETTLHDGTVRVSSAGARQEELAASLSAGDPPEPSSPAQAARGTTSACVRRRVLVVDDDRDSAESLAVLLAMLGHEVEQAYDGPAALAAVRRGAPDLVLLDLAMPGMSGYEVARRMRADNGSSKTVLIALTGYGADEDLRAAREAGFDGHLVKPIDFSALERILAGFPRR